MEIFYASFNKNKEIHSINNFPAIFSKNKIYVFYKNGEKHRDSLPAVIRNLEWNYEEFKELPIEEYYKKGKLHREKGPAQIFENKKTFYKEGKIHREKLPAIIIGEQIEIFLENNKFKCYKIKYFKSEIFNFLIEKPIFFFLFFVLTLGIFYLN